MPKRLLALITLPLATVLLLAGCTFSVTGLGADEDADTAQTDGEATDTEAAAPVEGEPAEPGTRVGLNEWLTYRFTSTQDGEAVISARLVSVEEATPDETDFINAGFDDGKVDGFTFYLLRLEEKKESGDTVEFDSDYSYFDAVDADGEKVQGLTFIGWDDCETNYFDEEFDTAGGVVTQCLIAALTPTGTVPAGVAYSGGYEDDNPYEFNEGNALYFIKK